MPAAFVSRTEFGSSRQFKLRQQRNSPGQTLQPTMLVHEAYLRLVDVEQPPQWNGRGHFFGAAAEAMRRILVEKARRKESQKHGGHMQQVELDVTLVPDSSAEHRAASLNAGLASAFRDDQSVVLGSVGHSVLKSLAHTVNVPHVVLRDTDGGGPITRPKSPEVPQSDSDSRYCLDGEIARGGMGAILKGRDTDLGRDLAIKVLLDSYKDKPEVIQRFIEEARIGGQLQLPGIAPIFELGQFSDKRPFYRRSTCGNTRGIPFGESSRR